MKNISCQIALYPLRKEYADDVKAVLNQFDPGCLTVQVGMMSTLLVGPEDIVWQKVRELYELGKQRGARFVLHVCFSDACVKDDVCDL
ncbi:MAG: YkoF family thiamine/hydroxymethylpyrimidine-binding protein [Bacillota bacterium]